MRAVRKTSNTYGDEIHRRGGWAHIVPADLSRGEAVDELAETIADRFGSVDILVNNAGRSIRRTALDSVDRFHDYERTMALNYFGPTRLTLRLLPAMLEAKSGHIINVGTWGVTAGVMPRFSAYHASKSALSAFGEASARNVTAPVSMSPQCNSHSYEHR